MPQHGQPCFYSNGANVDKSRYTGMIAFTSKTRQSCHHLLLHIPGVKKVVALCRIHFYSSIPQPMGAPGGASLCCVAGFALSGAFILTSARARWAV